MTVITYDAVGGNVRATYELDLCEELSVGYDVEERSHGPQNNSYIFPIALAGKNEDGRGDEEDPKNEVLLGYEESVYQPHFHDTQVIQTKFAIDWNYVLEDGVYHLICNSL